VIVEGKAGLAVERRTMQRALEQVLTSGTRQPLQVLTRPVQPKRHARDARPVIVITAARTRSSSTTRRARARVPRRDRPGAYPTPSGSCTSSTSSENPWWTPPASPWASALKPVPPGPGNPLGTRWMGLDAPGVGIHGTPDDASIGYSASHGCIRMHIPRPSGCSSTSASARRSSFSRQLDAEVRQHARPPGERDEAGDDQRVVAALANVRRECPTEQDQHAQDEPDADDEGGGERDPSLPRR
jgi:hypothetical protein